MEQKQEVIIDGNTVKDISLENLQRIGFQFSIPPGMIKVDMQFGWENGKKLTVPVYMYWEQFEELTQQGVLV